MLMFNMGETPARGTHTLKNSHINDKMAAELGQSQLMPKMQSMLS